MVSFAASAHHAGLVAGHCGKGSIFFELFTRNIIFIDYLQFLTSVEHLFLHVHKMKIRAIDVCVELAFAGQVVEIDNYPEFCNRKTRIFNFLLNQVNIDWNSFYKIDLEKIFIEISSNRFYERYGL